MRARRSWRSAPRRSRIRACRSGSRGSSPVAELVVAFDVPSGREALALAKRLPGLRWAKLGPGLYVREGPALAREFLARGLRVFLDLKWHDIPSTVAGAVAAARELGVAMASVHCLGGADMLAAAAQAAGEVALVGVTVLTSHDGAGLGQVLGRGVPDVSCEAERLARLAVRAGLRGVVASGAELALLRNALGPPTRAGCTNGWWSVYEAHAVGHGVVARRGAARGPGLACPGGRGGARRLARPRSSIACGAKC